MRTTVIMDDAVYAKLVSRSVKEYGSVKRLSQTLNGILAKEFSSEPSLFGAWRGEKGLNRKGLRDEGEPH